MSPAFDDQRLTANDGSAAASINFAALTRSLHASRVIGVAIFNDAQILDIAAALEIFRSANVELRERARLRPFEQPYRVLVFGAKRGASRTSSGLHIVATHEYADAARYALDTLVVVGGLGPDSKCPPDLVQFVSRAATGARRIVALGSGALVLAQARLLVCRRATTHWRARDRLARTHPEVHVEADRLFVKDANVYTAAGGAASLDLCLALVQEDFGFDVAAAIASRKIMSNRRTGDECQLDADLWARRSASSRIRLLANWVTENPRREFSIELLASHAAMSVRTLSRLFRRELGISPSKFVEKVRLEIARKLLADSDLGMQVVASQSGFGTEDRMRRAFRRAFGKSPREYVAMQGTRSQLHV